MLKSQMDNKSILLILCLSIMLIGCSTKNSVYNIDNRMLNIGKDINSAITVNFTNPQVQRNTSSCVLDSYTLFDRNNEYGNLFIEAIDLESSCDWTGSALSFFESSVRRALKANMTLVEDIDVSGYNFRTYKVNNDSYMNIIYIYSGGEDKFIIDYYGRLHDKVLKSFKPDYINKYFAKKRFIGYYNESLVRKNIVNRYFERERIEVIPRIGISISL